MGFSGFPVGSEGKASSCNVADPTWIPGSRTSLEKEIGTHSSTLAWKIPWAEESGRLQSMGPQSWTQLSDFTLWGSQGKNTELSSNECSNKYHLIYKYPLINVKKLPSKKC